MRILFLADANSAHTFRWVNAVSERGVEVFLFSLSPSKNYSYDLWTNVKIFECDFGEDIQNKFGNRLDKSLYLKALPQIKKIIGEYKIDIIHAHYGTSYGLLATLTAFPQRFISFWGTDVTEFPKVSFLHKNILKFILFRNQNIFTTSKWLKNALSEYTSRAIRVIPFGVDTSIFFPASEKNEDVFRFGIVKSLEKQYNIDFSIQVFSEILNNSSGKNFELMIIGNGTERASLEKLCDKLGISDKVKFIGNVNYLELPTYYRQMDIFLNFPSMESFGVSVLEASATGIPVVTSSVEGLNETVIDNETGFRINSFNVNDAAEKIIELINNPKLREEMGKKGRAFVKENFEWRDCVDRMLAEYERILK